MTPLPCCKEVCISKSEVKQTEKSRAPSCIPQQQGLTLNASLGNGSCCMVLGGEDIAAGPPHLKQPARQGWSQPGQKTRVTRQG